jgi:Lipase (class 3)
VRRACSSWLAALTIAACLLASVAQRSAQAQNIGPLPDSVKAINSMLPVGKPPLVTPQVVANFVLPYAQIADDAYAKGTELPSGFKHTVTKVFGPNGETVETIIAFAGTENWEDIKTDVNLATNVIDQQVIDAMKVVLGAAQAQSGRITVVGHSLGGTLALIAAKISPQVQVIAINPYSVPAWIDASISFGRVNNNVLVTGDSWDLVHRLGNLSVELGLGNLGVAHARTYPGGFPGAATYFFETSYNCFENPLCHRLPPLIGDLKRIVGPEGNSNLIDATAIANEAASQKVASQTYINEAIKARNAHIAALERRIAEFQGPLAICTSALKAGQTCGLITRHIDLLEHDIAAIKREILYLKGVFESKRNQGIIFADAVKAMLQWRQGTSSATSHSFLDLLGSYLFESSTQHLVAKDYNVCKYYGCSHPSYPIVRDVSPLALPSFFSGVGVFTTGLGSVSVPYMGSLLAPQTVGGTFNIPAFPGYGGQFIGFVDRTFRVQGVWQDNINREGVYTGSVTPNLDKVLGTFQCTKPAGGC